MSRTLFSRMTLVIPVLVANSNDTRSLFTTPYYAFLAPQGRHGKSRRSTPANLRRADRLLGTRTHSEPANFSEHAVSPRGESLRKSRQRSMPRFAPFRVHLNRSLSCKAYRELYC